MEQKSGVFILDKPEGFTSFDAVAVLRKLFSEKKIGHTGTLDPMATGVLVILIGRAAKAASLIENNLKEYTAGFKLGMKTDTEDSSGKIITESGKNVSEEELQKIMEAFRGSIYQTPPMYSAISVNGERLYKLARKGIVVEREKRLAEISLLSLLDYDENARVGRIKVRCSAGTYIRTLISDIGEALGTFAVMTSLRRTEASGFTLDDSFTLEKTKEFAENGELWSMVRPVESLFSCRKLYVSPAQAVRFANGGGLSLDRVKDLDLAEENEKIMVYSPESVFLGLGSVDRKQNLLTVLKLFNCV